jgi:hypothetical protein
VNQRVAKPGYPMPNAITPSNNRGFRALLRERLERITREAEELEQMLDA